MNEQWSRDSWRNFPIKQQPSYADKLELHKVEQEIAKNPPLVSGDEIDALRGSLEKVCDGKSFLLQAGDCAESFKEFSEENLELLFRVMLQMTVALMYGSGLPVVKVARIAGQFVKPRSNDTEVIDGKEFLSYRGDMVNDIAADDKLRVADPERLLHGYWQSAATMNYLRTIANSEFASFNNINEWNKIFLERSKNGKSVNDSVLGKINQVIKDIAHHVQFMEACSIDTKQLENINRAVVYSSHEALLLNYEEAMVRRSKSNGKNYCLSGHMLWIGDRTRALKEAHVEFVRGVENPIGIKVGPTAVHEEIIEVVKAVNPDNRKGKVVLISRMGHDKVADILPKLITSVEKAKLNVIWSCDPMHGNTEKTSNNYKTRKFENIASEIEQFFNVHNKMGTFPGGIHVEMTGQDVTECLGGNQSIDEEDLHFRYNTHCDPRLNGSQGVELAFKIAEYIGKK